MKISKQQANTDTFGAGWRHYWQAYSRTASFCAGFIVAQLVSWAAYQALKAAALAVWEAL